MIPSISSRKFSNEQPRRPPRPPESQGRRRREPRHLHLPLQDVQPRGAAGALGAARGADAGMHFEDSGLGAELKGSVGEGPNHSNHSKSFKIVIFRN